MPFTLHKFFFLIYFVTSVGVFLAKNTWGVPRVGFAPGARRVVPLFLSASRAIHFAAVLVVIGIVRFPPCPRRIVARQWSVVDPVELLVGFSGKAKPYAQVCDGLLLLHQAKDEVIFLSCSDYGEVSSQILASSSSVSPVQGWDIDDEET